VIKKRRSTHDDPQEERHAEEFKEKKGVKTREKRYGNRAVEPP
jgi:hypothetical protein